MASWAPGGGRSRGGIVGVVVPPKKEAPQYTLMNYIASHRQCDESEASSSEESVGALKAANDRRVDAALEQARQQMIIRDEYPSDAEEGAEGRKKALEMIHKMEWMKNQNDTWKVPGPSTRKDNDESSLHPLNRNDNEEYYSGMQKPKPKVRKRIRSETIILEEGFFQQPDSSSSKPPPGIKASSKVRVPSTGLPYTPGPLPSSNNNPWMQRRGADLFSVAPTRSIVAYGVTVQNEEEALALAIAESIRTANEERNFRQMINLVPKLETDAEPDEWSSEAQIERLPPDPPGTHWDTDDDEKEPCKLPCQTKVAERKDFLQSSNKNKKETFSRFGTESDKSVELQTKPHRATNVSVPDTKSKKMQTFRESCWDTVYYGKEEPDSSPSPDMNTKERDCVTVSSDNNGAFDEFSFHKNKPLEFSDEPRYVENISCDEGRSKKDIEVFGFGSLQNEDCNSASSRKRLSKSTTSNADVAPKQKTRGLPPRRRFHGILDDSDFITQKIPPISPSIEGNIPASNSASNYDGSCLEKESVSACDSRMSITKESVQTDAAFTYSSKALDNSSEQIQPLDTTCGVSFEEVKGSKLASLSNGKPLYTEEAAQLTVSSSTEPLETDELCRSDNSMKARVIRAGNGGSTSHQDTLHPTLWGPEVQGKPSRLPKSLPVAAGAHARLIIPVKEPTPSEALDNSLLKHTDVSNAQQFLKFETRLPKSMPIAAGARLKSVVPVKEPTQSEALDSSLLKHSDVSDAQQFLKFEANSCKFPTPALNQNLLESLINNNIQGIEAVKLDVSCSNSVPPQDSLTNMSATQIMPSVYSQNLGHTSNMMTSSARLSAAQNELAQENQRSEVPPLIGQHGVPNFSSAVPQFPPFMTPEQITQIMPQMTSPQLPQMVPQMAQISPDIMTSMAMYHMALQQQYQLQLQQAMACYSFPQIGQVPGDMSLGLNAMQAAIMSSQGQPISTPSMGLLAPGSLPSSIEMRPGLSTPPAAKGRGRLRPSMLH